MITVTFDEFAPMEGLLVDEKHVLILSGKTLIMLSVEKVSENVYKKVSGVFAMLGEGIIVENVKQFLEEVKEKLFKMTLYSFIVDVCDHSQDFNFDLYK